MMMMMMMMMMIVMMMTIVTKLLELPVYSVMAIVVIISLNRFVKAT